jgi:hypothetical protein
VLSLWLVLTESQHNAIILALPVLLFAIDFMFKTGLKIPTETAGPDLALVGVGLDISAIMLTTATPDVSAPEAQYLTLLVVLWLIHFAL